MGSSRDIVNFGASIITNNLSSSIVAPGSRTLEGQNQVPLNRKSQSIVETNSNDFRTRIYAKRNLTQHSRTATAAAGRTTSDSGYIAVYGDRRSSQNPLRVLYDTRGVVFPYTPTINITYSANWSVYDLAHTNYQPKAYSNSQVSDITVDAQFTAQDPAEAEYSYAVYHFFRSVTKMYFGNTSKNRDAKSPPPLGAPPPVLYFSSHGDGIFKDIPVVVSQFVFTLPQDIDYVPVYVNDTVKAWIPAMFTVNLLLSHQPNMKRSRDEFDLDRFRNGQLLNSGGWL